MSDDENRFAQRFSAWAGDDKDRVQDFLKGRGNWAIWIVLVLLVGMMLFNAIAQMVAR